MAKLSYKYGLLRTNQIQALTQLIGYRTSCGTIQG